MTDEMLLEGEDRLRSLFGEKSFLLMRKMRYGIGGCWGCGDGGEDVEVLAAQVGVVEWVKRKRVDDEVDGES